MNDTNTIRSLLEKQRNYKINEITNYEKKCQKLNNEINSIEQLLSLSNEQLQNFANILSQANSLQEQPNFNFQQDPLPRPIKPNIPVIKQPVQQTQIPQSKKGIGNVLKKKDKNDKLNNNDNTSNNNNNSTYDEYKFYDEENY